MKARVRDAKLFTKPSLLILVGGSVLLQISVFMILKLWPTSNAMHERVDVSEVSVIHVQRSGYQRNEVGMWAMRDGAYFREEKQVGLFSLTSHRRQYKGVVPEEFSLGQLRSIVSSNQFRVLARPYSRAAKPAWYVHVNNVQPNLCIVLSETDAGSPEFAALINWFKGVQQSGETKEHVVYEAWGDEDPDWLIDRWCEGYWR